MVLVLYIASLALAAVSAVSGRVVPRKNAPPGWACDNLEPYDQYHSRYLQFDCQAHHGTQYFDQCCHPRPANETNVPFPSQCGCDDSDNGDDSSSSYSTQMTPTPTDVSPTPSVSPEPEQSSEPSSSSTPVPSPTPSPVSDTSSTSTPVPSPTPSPVSDTSSTSTNSGSSSNVHTGGVATFFYQNGVAGACGQVHSDTDFICAIDQDLFGTSGPSSSLCGKQVTITNTQNGNTVTVTVADDCPTCNNANSIDLSLAAFQQLGQLSEGEIPITWVFDS